MEEAAWRIFVPVTVDRIFDADRKETRQKSDMRLAFRLSRVDPFARSVILSHPEYWVGAFLEFTSFELSFLPDRSELHRQAPSWKLADMRHPEAVIHLEIVRALIRSPVVVHSANLLLGLRFDVEERWPVGRLWTFGLNTPKGAERKSGQRSPAFPEWCELTAASNRARFPVDLNGQLYRTTAKRGMETLLLTLTARPSPANSNKKRKRA